MSFPGKGWCSLVATGCCLFVLQGLGAEPPAVASPPVVPSPVAAEPSLVPWVLGTLVALAVFLPVAWYLTRRYCHLWSLPRRVLVGFATMLVVLAALGLGACTELHRAVLGFVDYRQYARDAMLAGRIQANFLDLRLFAKDYQITHKPEDVKNYAARLEKVLTFIAEGENLFQRPQEREALTAIAAKVARHRELFQHLHTATTDAAIAEVGAQMAEVGTATDHQIEDLKLAFVDEQNRLGPIINRRVRQIEAAIGCAAAGAVVFGGFLAWLIMRSVTKTLVGMADDVASGATQTAAASAQMSSASQTLAEGTGEQAASLEETSASLEELTSMVRRNADAAATAMRLAGETRTSAEVGSADMTEMQAAMNAIKTSSGEVAKIARAIDEIAFQTNILALNAAVEAARAGDAGMGFAVVADEVRSLAQRSATSARETAARIEDAIVKTDRGVVISAKVAAGLATITQRSREVDQYVSEIAGASSEQSQGVNQISLAVTQLDRTTQNNAAIAEESAAAAEELASQAESLRSSAKTLQSLAGVGSITHLEASLEAPKNRQSSPAKISVPKVKPLPLPSPARNGRPQPTPACSVPA